jgi:hypothetical protein
LPLHRILNNIFPHYDAYVSSYKSNNQVKATWRRKYRSRLGAKLETKSKALAKSVEEKAVNKVPEAVEETDVGEDESALPNINDKDEEDEGSNKEDGIVDVRPAMTTGSRSKSREFSVGFIRRGGRGGIWIWCRPRKYSLI